MLIMFILHVANVYSILISLEVRGAFFYTPHNNDDLSLPWSCLSDLQLTWSAVLLLQLWASNPDIERLILWAGFPWILNWLNRRLIFWAGCNYHCWLFTFSVIIFHLIEGCEHRIIIVFVYLWCNYYYFFLIYELVWTIRKF